MTIDLAIIGIVFALILAIIFFSAIVLYLSFRIKETFRKETRKGFTIVKVGFLIGILFLAGGIFYFFANTIGNMTNPAAPSPLDPYLNFTVSYPHNVTVNTQCTIAFTVINPTNITAHGATIQANILFANFAIQISTHEVLGNVIKIGDVEPGTTIVSLEVSTPSTPRTITDTASLLFQERTDPVTQEITIKVEDEADDTPSPLPSSTPTPTPSSTEPPPSTPTPTPTTTEPVLSLSVSYPTAVSQNSNLIMSFTIRNTGDITAHGATIEANIILTEFTVVSSTREVIGNVVNIGDVPPGTTILSLQLLSPNRPGTITDTFSLSFQEMTAPVTQEITITIRGGQ
jgi:hypothetical protein